jgi:plastocyanin
MRTRGLIILAVSAALALVPLVPAYAVQTVAISDYSFSPDEIVIPPDTTVTWQYALGAGASTHTVTADDGHSFESQDIAPGGSYNNHFVSPGTFRYYCKYHGSAGGSGMAGIVRVTGSSPSPSPKPSKSTTPSSSPRASASPKATKSPSPSPAATTSATAQPTPSDDPAPEPTASSTVVASGPTTSGGSGATVPIAIGAVLIFGGSGVLVYFRFLKPR